MQIFSKCNVIQAYSYEKMQHKTKVNWIYMSAVKLWNAEMDLMNSQSPLVLVHMADKFYKCVSWIWEILEGPSPAGPSAM